MTEVKRNAEAMRFVRQLRYAEAEVLTFHKCLREFAEANNLRMEDLVVHDEVTMTDNQWRDFQEFCKKYG